MRYRENPSQNELFDVFKDILSDTAYRKLKKSWQHLFRLAILRLMPVQQLAKPFDPILGRPTKELYSMAALLFIMEFRCGTHEQAADAYMFDVSL